MPWNSLILGALLAGIAWSLSWPEDPVVRAEEVTGPERRRSRVKTIDWSALDDGTDTSRQHRAWLDLQEMSGSDLRAALVRGLNEVEKGKLSNSMKLLLVEWARKDPAATFEWAWEHLRESRNWPAAYEQIGSQWAGDDPVGFCEFALRHLHSTEKRIAGAYFGERDTDIDHLLTSEEIFLGGGEGIKGVNWLLKSSPREAFIIFRKFRSSYVGEFEEMANTLDSGGELASALSAWDNYDSGKEALALQEVEDLKKELEDTPEDQEKKDRLRTQEIRYRDLKHPSTSNLVQALIVRWREVDPEGFDKSRYFEWAE